MHVISSQNSLLQAWQTTVVHRRECHKLCSEWLCLLLAIHGMWGLLFMTMYNNFKYVLGLKDPLS